MAHINTKTIETHTLSYNTALQVTKNTDTYHNAPVMTSFVFLPHADKNGHAIKNPDEYKANGAKVLFTFIGDHPETPKKEREIYIDVVLENKFGIPKKQYDEAVTRMLELTDPEAETLKIHTENSNEPYKDPQSHKIVDMVGYLGRLTKKQQQARTSQPVKAKYTRHPA